MDSRLRGNDTVLARHLEVIPAKAGIHLYASNSSRNLFILTYTQLGKNFWDLS